MTNAITKRDLLSVGLKLIGIYFIVNFIYFLPMSFLSFKEIVCWDSVNINLICSFLTNLIQIILGFSLVFFGDKLSCFMLRDQNPELSKTDFSFSELQEIAFSTAGLIVFAQAFPPLVSCVANYIYLKTIFAENKFTGSYNTFCLNPWSDCFQPLISLMLSFILFFGAKGFSKLWQKRKMC